MGIARGSVLIQDLPERTSATIALAAVLTAALVGAALAYDVPLGIALLCAAFYLPIAALNLSLGVALWVPLVFLEGLPVFNLAGKAAGLVLVAGWIGALRSGRVATDVLAKHRRLVGVLALFAVWLSLSLLWAPDLARARSDIWHWWALVVLFLVVASSITTDTALALAAAAFVAGAVASVLVSYLAGGGLASADARLEVASGNPNLLAAGLVPAISLAAALTAQARGLVAKWLLVLVTGMLVVGVVASQSRGGLLAAAASGLTALILLKRRRRQVVALGLIVIGVAAASFMLDPSSWQRVTGESGRGSGRVDLWTVAWGVAKDHPLAGVGVNNFVAVAPDYVRRVGPLERVDLVADKPQVVHNVYLQLLAEAGLVGFVLFLVFAIGCLAAGWRAAKLFRTAGRLELEVLAQGIVIATVGMLAGNVFGSNAVDRRLWALFALGPAALGVAHGIAERSPVTRAAWSRVRAFGAPPD